MNNRAVFNKRLTGVNDNELDDFPTPPWATRAWMEILFRLYANNGQTVWECSSNRGYMVRPMQEFFSLGNVMASDVVPYLEFPFATVHDFLNVPIIPFGRHVDWIITNPPFIRAADFIERGLLLARVGVAVLVRTSFLEGVRRYERLFRDNPPNAIWQYVERVPMVQGRYDPVASTATSYCWLLWKKSMSRREPLQWIPPSKKRLIKPQDELCLVA